MTKKALERLIGMVIISDEFREGLLSGKDLDELIGAIPEWRQKEKKLLGNELGPEDRAAINVARQDQPPSNVFSERIRYFIQQHYGSRKETC